MPNQIKLICFDLNKTLIRENSWYNLNLAMGITKQEDSLILKFYDEGIIDYNEGQQIIMKLYQKRGTPTKNAIQKALFKFKYRKGAKKIIEYLNSKGYKIALISGSMDILIEKIAKDLNIPHYFANNQFVFDKAGRLTQIRSKGDEDKSKLQFLKQLCVKLHIKLSECACIGDGANDLLLFQNTKHGVTFSDSKHKNQAMATIDSLLDLQNIF